VLSYVENIIDGNLRSENHICLRLHNQRKISKITKKRQVQTHHQHQEKVSQRYMPLTRMVQNSDTIRQMIMA
jgi:hypothetical protein